MALGTDKLLALARRPLVENLAERELNNPEGAGFDLRLGEVHGMILGDAFLGVEERQTPQYVPVKPSVMPDGGEWWWWNISDYRLVETIEVVNLPANLVAVIFSRTTLFRCGLALHVGPVHPGYSGTLTFGLKNMGAARVRIERGARIAHIRFQEIEGESGLYRGQWQGGRVVAPARETQV